MRYYDFAMLPGESWWGGAVEQAMSHPYTAESVFCFDFREEIDSQASPLYISDKGRFIWSEEPFKVDIRHGHIRIEGEGIALVQAGSTLKDAYLGAMKAHFPFEGKPLPEDFFRTAQYNTWMEHTYFQSQEKVLSYAHNVVKHGLTPGILIIDEGWAIDYGDWDFDRHKFPDPKAMIDELHSMGFRIMLWVCPYVAISGRKFVIHTNPIFAPDTWDKRFLRVKDGRSSVAIIEWWNGYSALLNFTNPWDVEFLDSQLQHLMQEYGVDGFKFDGGSYSNYMSKNAVNGELDCDLTPSELNAAWNAFGRRYTYHEYRNTWKAGGKSAIQRLQDRNHEWVGNGIDTLIPNSVVTSLLGYPFLCPDMIGGGQWTYTEKPGFQVDGELFVRMAQVSALFPMMQFSWAPWRVLSEEHLQLVKQSADLHLQMQDYICQLVHHAEQTGEPVIRCMEYQFPGQGFEKELGQFMLGDRILVAPVLEKGAVTKLVHLPKGMWRSQDGTVYQGGGTVEVPAPLDVLPWFECV